MSEIERKLKSLSFEDRTVIYEAIKQNMYGDYHRYYEEYGLKRPGRRSAENINFRCPNTLGHQRGDNNPSMTIHNTTGQFHCKGCGYKGNFQVYFRDYCEATHGNYAEEFITKFHLDRYLDIDIERHAMEMDSLKIEIEKFRAERKSEEDREAGEVRPIDVDDYNLSVKRLLNDPYMLDTLKKNFAITPEIVEEYRLGLDPNNKIVRFPQWDMKQNLVGWKCYNPQAKAGAQKWFFPSKDIGSRPAWPSPLRNLTKPKIYIFEGEPDTYCAIGMGLNAFTAGSSTAVAKLKETLGDQIEPLFTNKEVIIVKDDDESGDKYAESMADLLFPYAAQIKIVSLRRSAEFAKGLDETLFKDGGVDENGKAKPQKRSEKDFRDLMRKHGMGVLAKSVFVEAETMTKAYTKNPERDTVEVYKVNIAEALNQQYYDAFGMKEVEVVASVSAMTESSFNMPKSLIVECPRCSGAKSKACDMCFVNKMVSIEGDDRDVAIDLKLNRGKSNKIKQLGDNHYEVKLKADELLSLIETTRDNSNKSLRTILQIPRNCPLCSITYTAINTVYRITIERSLSDKTDKGETRMSSMTCLVPTSHMPQTNHTYRIRGVLSSHHKDQGSVMLVTSIQDIVQPAAAFRMSEHIHDTLVKFQPKEGETIDEWSHRRAKAFCEAAGLMWREDVMTACDLVYFSAAELPDHKLVYHNRGFLDMAIIGPTKSAKSACVEFLIKHFGVGEIVQCGGNITYAGIIGGVNARTNSITWGKIPMNHRGFLVLDEVQNMRFEDIESMNNLRNDGKVVMDKIIKAETKAMVRKVWISNDKSDGKSGDGQSLDAEMEGKDMFLMMKGVYPRSSIISRFDLAISAVNPHMQPGELTRRKFQELSVDYNEIACQNHIHWAHSRNAEDIVITPEFEEAIFAASDRLLEKYDKSTLLVGMEIPSKLMRLAVAQAIRQYSVSPHSSEKVLPKPEHVEFIEGFLNRIYTAEFFDLTQVTELVRSTHVIGDMTFLPSVLRFTDPKRLRMSNEFRGDALKSMFSDYFLAVSRGEWYIVNANEDVFGTGYKSYEIQDKLLNILTTRNFLSRTRRSTFQITSAGQEWLKEYIRDRQNPKYDHYYLFAGKDKSDNESGAQPQASDFGLDRVGVQAGRRRVEV